MGEEALLEMWSSTWDLKNIIFRYMKVGLEGTVIYAERKNIRYIVGLGNRLVLAEGGLWEEEL